ncbi:MAG: bifunctional phosphoribosyl-AMP cyclohydrolase/phosphoribosyl-ATP diphosphatase HisIE [Trueperaceae bacterium]
MSSSAAGAGGGNEAVLFDDVRFDERGLVPVIAQDHDSGEVLMLAYADRESLRLTVETGRAHYFSRSRGRLWRKGDSSGNIQQVREVALDCDGDAVLYRLAQTGPACHTGARSCFFRTASVAPDGSAREPAAGPTGTASEPAPAAAGAPEPVAGESGPARAFELLERVVGERLRDLPEGSYVTRLHARGLGYEAQKVVEEAGETIVAALEGKDDELVAEAADLLFHLTVVLHERGQSMMAVASLLEERHRDRGKG